MVEGLNFYRTMYDQVSVFSGNYQPIEQTANVDADVNVGIEDNDVEVQENKEESSIFLNINKSISQELAIVLLFILAVQMAILITK